MNKIKERLKELRKEKDYKQKEVAKYLGISTTCYAGYEQGYREPNADTIIEICLFYNITTDYLLGLEDENGNKINQEVQTIHNDNRNYNINTKNHRGNINIK